MKNPSVCMCSGRDVVYGWKGNHLMNDLKLACHQHHQRETKHAYVRCSFALVIWRVLYFVSGKVAGSLLHQLHKSRVEYVRIFHIL